MTDLAMDRGQTLGGEGLILQDLLRQMDKSVGKFVSGPKSVSCEDEHRIGRQIAVLRKCLDDFALSVAKNSIATRGFVCIAHEAVKS